MSESVVEQYPDGEIDFETLVAHVGREDAEAVRVSRELLDRGQDVADDLADR